MSLDAKDDATYLRTNMEIYWAYLGYAGWGEGQLMEEIRSTPVTAEELSLAKESILNGFVSVIESPAALAQQYATLEFKEYPAGWLDRYREIVRSTTIEDVQRMAKEYLKPESMKVVLVGDPAAFDAPPADLGPPEVVKPR